MSMDGDATNKRSHSSTTTKEQDPFLASMTFADHLLTSSCDCDDCGYSGGGGNVPAAIAAAVKRYKLDYQNNKPLKRTQNRVLTKRHGQFAVYQWSLPAAAEPTVEFGSSHRLVWIQKLADASILQSIGKGVIGSADEESKRLVVDWKEGDVVLVPSNGGKAVGWVHQLQAPASASTSTGSNTSNDNDDAGSSKETIGHVELCIAKVPTGVDQTTTTTAAAAAAAVPTGKEDASSSVCTWFETIQQVCRSVLQLAHQNGDCLSDLPTSILLDECDAQKIRQALKD